MEEYSSDAIIWQHDETVPAWLVELAGLVHPTLVQGVGLSIFGDGDLRFLGDYEQLYADTLADMSSLGAQRGVASASVTFDYYLSLCGAFQGQGPCAEVAPYVATAPVAFAAIKAAVEARDAVP